MSCHCVGGRARGVHLRRPGSVAGQSLQTIESRLAPAVVTGFAFNDLNGDGVRQTTEPGLPNVTVYLDLNNNGKFDAPSGTTNFDAFAKSGSEGRYTIQTAATGVVTVAAVTPDGATPTSPSTTVTLNSNTTTMGPNFGFKLPPPTGGVIRGNVFNDGNGNGSKDANEAGVSNVVVFLDLNNNGKFDAPTPASIGEPAVKSSTTGVYEIKAPGDGTFAVTVVAPTGLNLTTPGAANVAVAGGQQVVGPNFGLQAPPPPPPQGGVIRGHVFNDGNGNGALDPNEAGVGGVIVFLDLNNNGKFDPPTNSTTPGEPAVGSSSTGVYEIKAPTNGTFAVTVVTPQGLNLTTPGSANVAVSGGQQVVGPNFGLQAPPPPPPQGGVIRGTVFNDLNGDGTRQNTEPGVGGVTVFLDLNNNGKFDAPTAGTVGEPAVKSTSTGVYEIKAPGNGTFAVTVIAPTGTTLTTPGSANVAVSGGQQVPGPNFGLQQPPPPPPTGGVVTGTVFVDVNGDGIRQNTEGGQPGVVVFLDLNNNGKFDAPTNTTTAGEPFSVTGKDGHYEIKVAKDGTYPVLEVVPQGFQQTAPTTVVSVNVAGGAVVPGPTFGNQPPPPPPPPGAVVGRVFRDGNSNGKLDAGEPGMLGVRVFDDVNDNGKWDNGERYTFSGPDGQYFMLLPPGAHNIDEVIPTGFVETVEPGTVTIVSGQIVFDQHFGLSKLPPTAPLVSITTVINPRGWVDNSDDGDTLGTAQLDFHGGVLLA